MVPNLPWQAAPNICARVSIIILQVQERYLPDAREGTVGARGNFAILKIGQDKVKGQIQVTYFPPSHPSLHWLGSLKLGVDLDQTLIGD